MYLPDMYRLLPKYSMESEPNHQYQVAMRKFNLPLGVADAETILAKCRRIGESRH